MIETPRHDSLSFSNMLASADSVQKESLQHRSFIGSSLNRCKVKEIFNGNATRDLAIVLMVEGASTVSHIDLGFGASSGNFRSGDFVLIPPFIESVARGKGSFEQISLAIPWADVLTEINLLGRDEFESFGRLHARVQTDPLVEQMVWSLWSEEKCPTESELFSEAVTALLLFRLLQLSGQEFKEDSGNRRLERTELDSTISYMHDFHSEQISLQELSELIGCSRFHFCRLFKDATGLSPNQYLIRVRVEHARALVKRGGSLVEVAHDCGFSDQAHLNRQFKRMFGVSPHRYFRDVTTQ